MADRLRLAIELAVATGGLAVGLHRLYLEIAFRMDGLFVSRTLLLTGGLLTVVSLCLMCKVIGAYWQRGKPRSD